MRLERFFLTVLFQVPFLCGAAPGDIYYVDTNHASANDATSKVDNSEDSPWKTIQRAADVLTAGETVQVKNGTYTELQTNVFPNTSKLAIKPQADGTAGNSITYQAFPGHRPVIDQNFQGSGFYLEGRHYIVIDGFEMTRLSKAGVWNNYGCASAPFVNCSTFITVKNCVIHDQDGGGNQGGIRFDGVSNGLIRNNIIHTVRVNGDVRQFNSAAIHSFNMDNTVIEENELYNSGNGLYYKQAPDLPDPLGVIVRNNIIHDVNTGALYTNAGNMSPPHKNLSFHNNIVYNAARCIHAKQRDTPLQSDGLDVFSNTFDNCTLQSDGFLNNQFYNNIYFMDAGNRQILTEHGGNFWESEIVLSDYNNYFPEFNIALDRFGENADFSSLASWQNACAGTCPGTLNVPAPGPGQNSLAVDPGFVDRVARNYRLQSSSALIGQATPSGDIGAYTTGTELIGPCQQCLGDAVFQSGFEGP